MLKVEFILGGYLHLQLKRIQEAFCKIKNWTVFNCQFQAFFTSITLICMIKLTDNVMKTFQVVDHSFSLRFALARFVSNMSVTNLAGCFFRNDVWNLLEIFPSIWSHAATSGFSGNISCLFWKMKMKSFNLKFRLSFLLSVEITKRKYLLDSS